MQYVGGKFRHGKTIASFINKYIIEKEAVAYYEPFVGACNVLNHVVKSIPHYASDINEDIILLWKEIQNGWVPPTSISEDTYKSLKFAEPSAIRAFAGFGCSFGGKWFGGYARNALNTNYCLQAHYSCLRKKNIHAQFFHTSYEKVDPMKNSVIYCDPPYLGTTNGYKNNKFSHENFYSVIQEWSKHSTVLVSEYTLPSFGKEIWLSNQTTGLTTQSGFQATRIDKLFLCI